MIKKIAFIGVTGMPGKPVAAELLKAGFIVRALVRDPEKAKGKLPVIQGPEALTQEEAARQTGHHAEAILRNSLAVVRRS